MTNAETISNAVLEKLENIEISTLNIFGGKLISGIFSGSRTVFLLRPGTCMINYTKRGDFNSPIPEGLGY